MAAIQGQNHYSEIIKIRLCNIPDSIPLTVWGCSNPKLLDTMRKNCSFLSVLQGQAVDILHTMLAEAMYDDIVGHFRTICYHQLAVDYRLQLKVRVQIRDKSLQEFAAAMEQPTH
jgi:hypothetical protein